MGEATAIEWTHHTFNPWWGCAKVSEGCKNCYAEAFAKRVGHRVWGEGGERRRFGEKHWAEPFMWNARAAAAGQRRRVFCASMADVFEEHWVATVERPKLWSLIEATPMLDWLLLTKRPENIPGMIPWDRSSPPPNVWLGTTAENQHQANLRVPALLRAPSAVRFVSAEPLLERVSLHPWLCIYGTAEHGERCRRRPGGVDWVIGGGESGPGARPCAVEWLQTLVDDCYATGAAAFVKQLGARPAMRTAMQSEVFVRDGLVAWRPRDAKGGDMAEFPQGLRVRMFPGDRWPVLQGGAENSRAPADSYQGD